MCKSRSISLLRDGTVTCAALFLSFVALDDITTGNETNFSLEYGALLIAAAWMLFVTFRLIRTSQQVLGMISLAVLVGALWAQREIMHGVTLGVWPAYVMTVTAFVWFLIIAIFFLISGWQSYSEWQRQSM